jgi:hypothetical protein
VAERLVLDEMEANEVRANPLGLVLLILFVIFIRAMASAIQEFWQALNEGTFFSIS